MAEAASLFALLGHELETAAPPVGSEEVLSPMLPLIASAAAMPSTPSSRARGRRLAADELQPTTLGAREYARNISGAQYVSCVDACHEITRRVGRFWTGATDRGDTCRRRWPVCPPPSVVTPWTTPITWPTVWARRA